MMVSTDVVFDNILQDDLSSVTGTLATNSELNYNGGTVISENTLYGRSKERLALLKAYQRLLQLKGAQTVIVHGVSGSGKTALVTALRSQLCDQSPGYFVAGKYFQNEGGGVQEAHSAIMAAFSDLCDLVSQSDDFDEARRRHIKDALGSDAQFLVKSVGNLSPFVGDINDVVVQEDLASAGKFKVACKTFLRAMASNNHPIVIFLDDIQWADEGSRQLIEMFLQDSGLTNVMLVLAYRDEEEENVEELLSYARDPVDIRLSNLNVDAVHQIVSSIVGSCSERVRDLSDLVWKRTTGNPFHVMLFMETIEREGLLVFDRNSGECKFRVETIQMEIMTTESSVDLLARKVELLPQNIIEALKVACLLGYCFEESIVVEVACSAIDALKSNSSDPNHIISESTRETVLASLSDAVKGGFIERTRDGYQFTHDKLQATFQAFLGGPEEDYLHLLIGECFLAGSDGRQKKMYNAAVHLNRAPDFLYNRSQTLILAKINLEAAKYCEQKSGFIQAVKMLKNGLKLIDPHERWSETNFELSFEIMEALARMQLIVGDFESCKKTTKEALDHGRTVETQINLLMIAVEVRMAINEVKGIEGSLATSFGALRKLGVKMPRKITVLHVAVKLLKIKRILKRKSKDDLLNLPITQDRLATSSVKLLMHVCADSMVTDDVNSGMYAALLALELSLKMGLSPGSPSALIFFGIAEVSLGNVDRGYEYGKLALRMLGTMPCKEAECSTFGYALTMLTCRKDSYRQLMDPLFRASKSGYERGDVVYASYSLSQSFLMHIYLGTPLATVEDLLRVNYELVSDLKQNTMLQWFQPLLQYVTQMRSDRTSDWETISTMTGEFMVEKDYYRDVCNAGNLAQNMMCSIIKAEIAMSFDQYSIAARIYEEIRCNSEEAIHVSFTAPVYYWNAARAHTMLYQHSGKRHHLRKTRRYQKLLRRMEITGCQNATPLVAFLKAQEAVRGKVVNPEVLRAKYDTGIACLAEHSFLLFEATLNEKAGFDFADRGMLKQAKKYFDRALHIYRVEWGAVAKFNWLTAKSQLPLAKASQEMDPPGPYGTFVTVGPK